MSKPSASAVQLDYAPAAPMRRRRLVRRVILGLVLLILIVTVWRNGPGLWQKWRVRSITNQARVFNFSDPTVIYEEDPSAIKALLVRGGYRQGNPTPTDPQPAAVREDPPLLAQLAQITERGTGTFAFFGASATPNSPLAFLHERTSEKGVTRIVALRIVGIIYTSADGGSLTISYKAMPLEPRDKLPPIAHGIGEGRGPDLNLLPSHALLQPDGPTTPGPIRIFAAHPVPNDPAAFILPYEIGSQRKSIKFSLVDDSLGRGVFVITVNQPRPRRPTTTPDQ